jgi:hypothetical protein
MTSNPRKAATRRDDLRISDRRNPVNRATAAARANSGTAIGCDAIEIAASIATIASTGIRAPTKAASNAGHSNAATAICSFEKKNCPGNDAIQMDITGQTKREGRRLHTNHETAKPTAGTEQ